MANKIVHCQLWMGSLEPYMDENFILTAFRKMGENPLNVKIMQNKITGQPAGYCFVHFATDEEAIHVMHKLNSKAIPGTSPVVRFKLNNATNFGKSEVNKDFCVWVRNLSPDVDDYILYRVFSSKYSTIKAAKVIVDNNGFSKGYGFVRFGIEEEMKDCLNKMNGYIGLGAKAIRVCTAFQKSKGASDSTDYTDSTSLTTSETDYSQYYNMASYWQNYASWNNVAQQVESNVVVPTPDMNTNNSDYELVEHSVPLDIDQINRETIELDCGLWDALESSKWLQAEAFQVA